MLYILFDLKSTLVVYRCKMCQTNYGPNYKALFYSEHSNCFLQPSFAYLHILSYAFKHLKFWLIYLLQIYTATS